MGSIRMIAVNLFTLSDIVFRWRVFDSKVKVGCTPPFAQNAVMYMEAMMFYLETNAREVTASPSYFQ